MNNNWFMNHCITSIVNELEEYLKIQINEERNYCQKEFEEVEQKKRNMIIKEKQLDDEINKYNERVDKYNYFLNYGNSIYPDYYLDYEKQKLDQEGKIIDKKNENFQIEKNSLIKDIKNNNANIKYFNSLNNEYNNLGNNIIIDFSGNSLKINYINKLQYIDLEEKEKDIIKFANIALDKALEIIAEYMLNNEQKKIMNSFYEKVNNNFTNIIKNSYNLNWNNCFNQLLNKNYEYNSNDMNIIANYNLKNLKGQYYYISDLKDNISLENALDSVRNKKILFGNYFDNTSNLWDCFCLIQKNNLYILLYKASNGRNIPMGIMDFAYEITNSDIILKTNKNIESQNTKYSEVYALENLKVISSNINDLYFIENFEEYNYFFRASENIIEEYKRNKYPRDFIKSIYDEKKSKYNSSTIGLSFFKYFYLEMKNANKIDFAFFNTIYVILNNYDEINMWEKKILNEEYFEIKKAFGDNSTNHLLNDENDISIKNNLNIEPYNINYEIQKPQFISNLNNENEKNFNLKESDNKSYNANTVFENGEKNINEYCNCKSCLIY